MMGRPLRCSKASTARYSCSPLNYRIVAPCDATAHSVPAGGPPCHGYCSSGQSGWNFPPSCPVLVSPWQQYDTRSVAGVELSPLRQPGQWLAAGVCRTDRPVTAAALSRRPVMSAPVTPCRRSTTRKEGRCGSLSPSLVPPVATRIACCRRAVLPSSTRCRRDATPSDV